MIGSAEMSKEHQKIVPKPLNKAARRSGGERKLKYTYDQVQQALRETAGVRHLAALKLKITRQYLHTLIKRWPGLALVEQSIVEENLDVAEFALLSNVRKGRSADVHFFLKHKGKARGYGDQISFSADGGGATDQNSHGVLVVPARLSVEEWQKLSAAAHGQALPKAKSR